MSSRRASTVQKLIPFEMVVDTTIAGNSGVGNFQIRVDASSTYRYKVDWGDGSISAITSSSNITHTYPSGGTYTVQISGRFDNMWYLQQAEADKILSINSWGNIAWKDFANAFYGAANLSAVTSDPPNVNSIANHNEPGYTDWSNAFADCINMDGDFGAWDMSEVTVLTNFFRSAGNFNNGGSPSISGWTTSACTAMNSLFYNNSVFNQPIGSWDVSNVQNMSSMFRGCGQFNNSGDTSISGWTTSACTNMISMFQNADSFNQPIGSWDVSNVTSISYMFHLNGGFNNGGSPSISGWTFSPSLTSMLGMFRAASIFNQPIGSWDVSNINNMNSMFEQATQFSQDIGSWDVSNVQNMRRMFRSTLFNNGGSPSISGWTTSACTNMYEMFYAANSFNQPIGSWDVSNVQDMGGMFFSVDNFDQDLGSWDVSNVNTTFSSFGMFDQASVFNNGGSPSISGWTFSPSLTDVTAMFRNTPLFNQPIGSWDVSNITNMSSMFQRAEQFDQDLGSWNVSNVQNFSSMFSDIAAGNVIFNNGGSPSISGWTTSACTNMSYMFARNYSFNQPIGSWDVSNVQNFSYMLGIGPSIDASSMTFNQDVSGWDVSSATNMAGMFEGCSGFNQDLSSWVVTGVTDMDEMFENAGLSTTNYNKILTGWTGWNGVTATTQLQTGVTFGVNGLTYSSGTTAEDARNYLLTGLTWTINGDSAV